MSNSSEVPNGNSARKRPPRPDRVQDARHPDDTPPAVQRCFVISPIGRIGSDTRKRSDQILRHIIEPVVLAAGYEKPVRADGISESGRITRQIITHIIEDELVVADLTDSNPNVYYELALRHAVRKPFVQILAGDDPLPFDVADQRTIMVDYRDLDSVAAAREELGRQLAALASGASDIDTPLSFALDIATLQGSADPGDRTQGEILDMLQELRSMTRSTWTAVRQPRIPAADVSALRKFVEVTTQNGDVVDEDVERLVTPTTSPSHDEWVATVKASMSPFMSTNRTPTPVPSSTPPPDPWRTPPSGSFSDEPPF